MGKSPGDIASEIERLRRESDIIVDELERRATLPNLARGMTSTVTDRANLVANEAATMVEGADDGERLALRDARGAPEGLSLPQEIHHGGTE